MDIFIIQWGPLVLNGPLFMKIIFGAAGLLVVHLFFRTHPVAASVQNALTTASFVWLLVWKGSILIFDPVGTIEHPSSLLYFDGGERGQWLASAVALVAGTLKLRRQQIRPREMAHVLGVFVLFGIATHQVGLVLLARLHWTSFIFLLPVVSVVLYVLLRVAWLRSATDGTASRRRWVVQATIIIGVTLMGVQAISDGVKVQRLPGIGVQAPAFSLDTASGEPVTLASYKNQIVIVNFWASWCPPCRAEMPSLQTMHDRYKMQGVTVLAVNMTATESSAKQAVTFMANGNFTMPLALDTQGKTMEAYRIRAYPTTVIIDQTGIVQHIFEGAVHHRTLEKAIRGMEMKGNASIIR